MIYSTLTSSGSSSFEIPNYENPLKSFADEIINIAQSNGNFFKEREVCYLFNKGLHFDYSDESNGIEFSNTAFHSALDKAYQIAQLKFLHAFSSSYAIYPISTDWIEKSKCFYNIPFHEYLGILQALSRPVTSIVRNPSPNCFEAFESQMVSDSSANAQQDWGFVSVDMDETEASLSLQMPLASSAQMDESSEAVIEDCRYQDLAAIHLLVRIAEFFFVHPENFAASSIAGSGVLATDNPIYSSACSLTRSFRHVVHLASLDANYLEIESQSIDFFKQANGFSQKVLQSFYNQQHVRSFSRSYGSLCLSPHGSRNRTPNSVATRKFSELQFAEASSPREKMLKEK